MKFKITHRLGLIVIIINTLMLNGCLMADSFDYPYAYKKYEFHGKFPKRDSKLAEKTKSDMLECGFDNTSDNSDMIKRDTNSYIRATYCMKNKGYIMPNYPNNDICQHNLYKNELACK